MNYEPIIRQLVATLKEKDDKAFRTKIEVLVGLAEEMLKSQSKPIQLPAQMSISQPLSNLPESTLVGPPTNPVQVPQQMQQHPMDDSVPAPPPGGKKQLRVGV